jgi:hypothetical protein
VIFTAQWQAIKLKSYDFFSHFGLKINSSAVSRQKKTAPFECVSERLDAHRCGFEVSRIKELSHPNRSMIR